MGAGHTVGLAFGGLDDQVDATVVSEGMVQLEGEDLALLENRMKDDTSGRIKTKIPAH